MKYPLKVFYESSGRKLVCLLEGLLLYFLFLGETALKEKWIHFHLTFELPMELKFDQGFRVIGEYLSPKLGTVKVVLVKVNNRN